MTRLNIVLALMLVCQAGANAQKQVYEPSHVTPAGEELVLAFISSTWCVGNRAPGLHEAIEEAKLTMADRASVEGIRFRAVGVALDWPTADGIAYLNEFGEFDELVVGSNWFNLGVEELIWEDEETSASIPQVIIFRREVKASPTPSFGQREVLKRVTGGDAIVAWIEAGLNLDQ